MSRSKPTLASGSVSSRPPIAATRPLGRDRLSLADFFLNGLLCRPARNEGSPVPGWRSPFWNKARLLLSEQSWYIGSEGSFLSTLIRFHGDAAMPNFINLRPDKRYV